MADVTEREIFESAFQDEPPATTDAPAEPAVTGEKPVETGPTRDERGRFASQGQQEPAPAEGGEEPPEGQPGQQTEAERAKTAALREERDRRYAAEDEVRQLRDRLARLEGVVSTKPTPEPVRQPDPPAFWDEPEGFVDHKLTPFQRQIQELKETFSERLAVQEFGADTVKAAKDAMAAFAQQNPQAAAQLANQFLASPEPYGGLVNWHRQRQALTETGGDLKAYQEKLLKDPEFRKRAQEAWQADQQNGQSPSQNVIDLPSLGRTPGRGNAAAGEPTDRELFKEMFAGR